MRKKKSIKNRLPQPDLRFSSQLVSQLINKVLWDGEKKKATQIIYQTLEVLREKLSLDPLVVLEEALENIKPSLETRSQKIGGSNQRVPYEVKPERSLTLALRWIVKAAREKKVTDPMFQRLAQEIMQARQKQGAAFEKKETIHKEAIRNMASAIYRLRSKGKEQAPINKKLYE